MITSSLSLCKASPSPSTLLVSASHVMRGMTSSLVCTFSPNNNANGGLLHSTRVTHALVSVAAAHTDRPNTRGTQAQRFLSPTGQLATRANIFTNVVSTNVAPQLVEVARAPTDLFDDMPVYEPNDFNGPPLSRVTFYSPMRTLPMPIAHTFFYREHGGSGGSDFNSGGRQHTEDEEDDRHSNNRGDSHSSFDAARGGPRFSRSGRNSGDGPLYCRLCRDELQPTVTARTHITTAGTGSHVNHPVREVALDTLTLLAIRGYPIDDILTVWADALYCNPALPRIPCMSNPRWTIEQRAHRLGDLLHALKKAGVIDVSLARQVAETPSTGTSNLDFYRRRRVGFERLEYIGDSFWGLNVTQRLVQLYPDQQWMYGERSFAFNAVRDAVEMNVNLDFVFDVLQLDSLLSFVHGETLGTGKAKADYVEAILGELNSYVIAFEPKLDDDVAYVEVNGAREAQLCALIQHCLTELYDLVVLQHARQLLSTALPLAKELAAKRIWLQTRPLLLQAKRSSRARESRIQVLRGNSTSSSTMHSATGSSPRAAHLARFDDPVGYFNASYAATAAAAYEEFFGLSPSGGISTTLTLDGGVASVDDETQVNAREGTGASSTTHIGGDGDVSTVTTSAQLADASLHGDHYSSEKGPATSATDAADAKSTTQAAVAAAARSKTTGAVLPTFETVSLSLAASIQRGATRVLPGLPRLFTAPRALPLRVPHPLRHLPPSAIPRATFCEHTKADVFAQLIASYHRLRLVSDDAAQPRYVVSARLPQWDTLISTLVPQLVRFAVQSDRSESAEKKSESKTEVNGLLFSLKTTTTSAAENDVNLQKSKLTSNARARNDSSNHGGAHVDIHESQTAESARVLLTSLETSEFYCRDNLYNLQLSASTVLSSSLPLSQVASVSPPSTVEWTLRNCGLPRLATKPASVAGSPNGSGNGGSGFDGSGIGTFADSRFVPPGTKPPPAGVVTDRNLCRGVFAFLAFGVGDPIKEAMEVQNALQPLSARSTWNEVRKEEGSSSREERELAAVPVATPCRMTEWPKSDAEELCAEEVKAACLYWKRQGRMLNADPDLFF